MVKGELEEKDFIQERKGGGGFKIWLFGLIIITLFGFLWLLVSHIITERDDQVDKSSFLQVTNRDFSLFLWQFPQYMRAHTSNKTGYLPGFHSHGKVSVRPEQADDYVQAPPDVIFLYHVWNRLLKEEFDAIPVPVIQFRSFLKGCPQWLPQYWSDAPQAYVELLDEIQKGKEDESILTFNDLPFDVFRAFQGWKNYHKDQDKINQINPNISQLKEFLSNHPHYNRNYWRNIYPDYLKSLNQNISANQQIPFEEFPAFLRVGYYNSLN